MIANHVILGDRTWDNVFETRRKSRLRGLDIKNNLLQGICLALDKNGLMLSGNCILSKQRTSSSGGNQCQEWCLESSLMSEFVALRVVSFTVRRRRRREEASNWFTLIISWFPFPSFASHDSWQPRDCCRKDERKRDDDKLINHTHIYNHLRLSLREAIIAWSRSCSSVLVSSYQERKKDLKVRWKDESVFVSSDWRRCWVSEADNRTHTLESLCKNVFFASRMLSSLWEVVFSQLSQSFLCQETQEVSLLCQCTDCQDIIFFSSLESLAEESNSYHSGVGGILWKPLQTGINCVGVTE